MSGWLKTIAGSDGFEWDEGNVEKNEFAHRVACEEAEQAFVNRPLFFTDDPEHSQAETRAKAFGRTDAGRLLTISFTMRGKRIRVISARDMNRKERSAYESRQR